MTISINTADKRDVSAMAMLKGARQWLKCSVLLPDGRRVRAYGIPSRSEPNVMRFANRKQCSCEDFLYRQPTLCAHIRAVRLYCAWVMARRQHQEIMRQEAQRKQRVNEEAAGLQSSSLTAAF